MEEQRTTSLDDFRLHLSQTETEIVEFMEIMRLARLQPDPPPPLPSHQASPPPTRRLPYTWGSKRRRSAIDRSPSPPRGLPSLSPAKKVKVDAASSPATTLAFPPSESEEKLSNKPVKITLSKLPKKIEDLQKLCDSLSTQRQALTKEVEKVQCYRDKLMEEQLLLKEKLRVEKEKQQLCLESELPSTSIVSTRLSISIAQPTPIRNQDHHQLVPYIVQQPSVLDRTAGGQAPDLLPCSTSGRREELFDLNVPVPEAAAAQPLEAVFANLRNAEMAAAQARLNRFHRKQKIQSKNNSGVAAAIKFRVLG